MRFTAETLELQEALRKVLPAVAKKPHIPVLKGVLFTVSTPEASGHARLTLTATNIEIMISTRIDVRDADDGATVFDADMIRRIVSAVTSSEITVTPDAKSSRDDHYLIRCGKARYEIPSLGDPADFPDPTASPDNGTFSITLPSEMLGELIHQTSYAAASNDSRAYLTGVNVVCDSGADDNTVRFTATNAYRLATATIRFGKAVQFDGSGDRTIPAVAMEVFAKILAKADADAKATLTVTQRHAFLSIGDDCCQARVIEAAKYPDWRRIMPTKYQTTVLVDAADLVSAIKQVSVMAEASEESGAGMSLILDPERCHMTVATRTQGLGAAVNEVQAKVEGEPLGLVCRYSYLLDILKRIPTSDMTTIQLGGRSNRSVEPIVIEYQGRVSEDFGAEIDVSTMVMPFNTEPVSVS